MKIKTRIEYNTFAKTEKAIEELVETLTYEISSGILGDTVDDLDRISKELLRSRLRYDKKLLKENFKQ